MTSFTFDVPYDEPTSPLVAEENASRRLREIVDSLREGERMAKEEEARRASIPNERLVTLKMPTELIERLDRVAEDAGTNRSQLIRQIAGDFLNYVWVNGISFRGSLLGFKHQPLNSDIDP